MTKNYELNLSNCMPIASTLLSTAFDEGPTSIGINWHFTFTCLGLYKKLQIMLGQERWSTFAKESSTKTVIITLSTKPGTSIVKSGKDIFFYTVKSTPNP